MMTALKRLLAALLNLALAPFRLVARLIKAGIERLRNWMQATEPVDEPFGAAVNKVSEAPQTLITHLQALRNHLLRSAVVVLIATLICLLYAHQLFEAIQAPLHQVTDQGLRISGPAELVDLIPRLALTAGIFFALPYVLLELVAFAFPGLQWRERLVTITGLLVTFTLFAFGAWFGYTVLLPALLENMLLTTNAYGIYDWELVKYLAFFTDTMFMTEFLFFSPLLVMVIRVMIPGKYALDLRVVVFMAFFVAMVMTPGTMVLLDLGLGLGLALLYLLNNLLLSMSGMRSRFRKSA